LPLIARALYYQHATTQLPFASVVGGGWSGTSEFVLYTSPTAKFQEEPNERGTTTQHSHKEHTCKLHSTVTELV